MNYCKHLKKRKNKPYCNILKKEITLSQCQECVNKEYHIPVKGKTENAQYNVKTVQKKKKYHTKKRITVQKEVYAVVIERDKHCCRLCGSTNWLALHHIRYRSERKDLINDVDNCIMLCDNCHRLVHYNKKYWQPILLDMNKKKNC